MGLRGWSSGDGSRENSRSKRDEASERSMEKEAAMSVVEGSWAVVEKLGITGEREGSRLWEARGFRWVEESGAREGSRL
jgi:hypothetical protein